MDEGPNNNKGRSSGEGEVKYRGVTKLKGGKYAAYIRDKSQNGKQVWLGSHDTAKEAAKRYDWAAFDMMGYSAILNFPQDYNFPSTSSNAQPQTPTPTATPTQTPIPTPSGSQQEREVFVIEYYDDQLLEDLLDDKGNEKED